MRKILALCAAVMVLASITARAQMPEPVSQTSRRMLGLNPNLIGITSDEYSDYMAVNTANILDISGYRLYTQLSNLGQTGGDEALAETTADADLLIGGVMPFNMGNIGAILWRNKGVVEQQIRFWNIGGVDANNIGNPNDNAGLGSGESETINKDIANDTLEKESGEAFNNTGDIDINLLLGLATLDFAELGLRLGYTKDVTAGIEREYNYSYSDDNDDDDYATMKYSATEDEYTTVLTIAPSIRGIQLGGIDLGGTIQLSMVSKVDNTEIDASFTEGSSFGWLGVGDDYATKYKSESIEELSGMLIGLRLDGSHPLNDSAKIKGLAMLRTGKLSGDLEVLQDRKVTEDGGGVAVEEWSQKQDSEIEENVMQMGLLVGIDKQVSDNLLMGIGLGLNRSSMERISDGGRQVTDTDGTEAYGLTKTKTTNKDANTSIVLPVGLEWRATNWLKARIGASYSVNYAKEETETVETTYEDNTKDADVTDVETTTSSSGFVPVADSVNFYAGVGFCVTENLTVDVTQLGTGNVLDLSNWQLSATLKF